MQSASIFILFLKFIMRNFVFGFTFYHYDKYMIFSPQQRHLWAPLNYYTPQKVMAALPLFNSFQSVFRMMETFWTPNLAWMVNPTTQCCVLKLSPGPALMVNKLLLPHTSRKSPAWLSSASPHSSKDSSKVPNTGALQNVKRSLLGAEVICRCCFTFCVKPAANSSLGPGWDITFTVSTTTKHIVYSSGIIEIKAFETSHRLALAKVKHLVV